MCPTNASKRKLPLARRQVFIIAITFIGVATVVSLSELHHNVTKKMAVQQFNQQQLILARSAASAIQANYEELSAALSSLAELPSIQQITSACLGYMQHTYWGLPSRTSLRLLDSRGILRFIYPFEDWRQDLIGRDYSEEAYFLESKESGHVIVSSLLANEKGDPRIRIAIPVYFKHRMETVAIGDTIGTVLAPIDPGDPRSGEFRGVLVGSFDPNTIAQSFVSPIISGKTGYAWLLGDDGIFLAHHEEGFTGRNALEVRAEMNPNISHEAIERIEARMMAGTEGVGRYICGCHRGQRGEIEKLVAFTPVHVGGQIWSMAVCAPVSEVEEIVKLAERSKQYTVGLVVLILMAGGASLSVTAHRWSRSLAQEVATRTKELRETHDYLSNLIRHANAPIIVWDPGKKVTIFNKAFEAMSGWNETEIKEQPLDVLFPEASRAHCIQKIESASKGEHWEIVEIPIQRRSGGIRIVLWNSANIYAEDGTTVIATVAQGQDITERTQAEKALRESEEKYRTMVEQSNDMIWTLDSDGDFIFINRRSEEIAGQRLEDWHGKSFAPLIMEEDMPAVIDAFRHTLDGEPQHYEARVKRDNGDLIVLSVNTAPILAGDKVVGTVSFGRDITERRRAEKALRESERQLREAQKMEAVGKLAGGIAHDFNNLLTAIQGYSEFALMKVGEDDPVRNDLMEIEHSAVRASNLTRQLLLFARRQPMELSPLNPNTLVKDMMKMLERLIGEDVTLRTELQDGLWTIGADHGNIEQVIMNLVVNARDAMPEGGEILVKTENVKVDEEYCRVHPDARPGDFVCLSVKDTGTGMNAETLCHVFEPFFTTKGPGIGTGLGLPVAYGIVKQHHGWIDVESAVERGTTFRVCVPIISTDPLEKPEVDIPLGVLRGSGERILLVEDEKPVKKFITDVLSEYGYVVYSAANAQEAVDIFEREGGLFDLIFSDVVLPDERGPQLVDRLLEIRPGLGVIFASGYSDEKSGRQAIRDRGYPYLQKPFSMTLLLKTVSRTLKERPSSTQQDP